MTPQEVAEYLAGKSLSQEIVNVSFMPTKLPWVEGIDYDVITGEPLNDIPTRLRDNTGEAFTTNPVMGAAQPPAPPVPVPLSEIGFITLCQDIGGMTDTQLVACDADTNFKAMWIKFRAAPQIDKDDPRVQAGLTGLAAAGYIPNGVDAINAAWPMA